MANGFNAQDRNLYTIIQLCTRLKIFSQICTENSRRLTQIIDFELIFLRKSVKIICENLREKKCRVKRLFRAVQKIRGRI